MAKLLMMLVSLVLLFGCQPAATQKKYLIGVTLDTLTNEYFAKIRDGIQAKATELGVEVNIQDGQGKDEVQIRQLETFINSKVDAIIIAAVNDNVPAIEALVKKAREKGIKVIAQSQRVDTADVYVSIEQDGFGFVGGKIAGEWIRDNMGGEAEVAIITYPDRPTILERIKGVKNGILSVAPKAKIVAEPPGQDPEKARNNFEAALQQNPNIRVVCANNDNNALAAANALQAKFGDAAGKSAKKYCVVGLDAIPQALAALKDPKSPFRGTVDIDPFSNGKRDVELAVALIQGKDLGITKKTPSGSLFADVEMKPVTDK